MRGRDREKRDVEDNQVDEGLRQGKKNITGGRVTGEKILWCFDLIN